MAVEREEPITTPEGDSRDLGFGSVVASQRKRLLNRDGTFNVQRTGLKFFEAHGLYHELLTMSWTRFFAVIILFYVSANTVFGTAYYLLGPAALAGGDVASHHALYWRAFFFSVQTFGTIGYGVIHPVSMTANIIVAVESLVGLLGFALATGLLFARFSRPFAKIAFSKQAVIAPFQGGKAFMFRIANVRSSQIIEVEAKLVLSRFMDVNGSATRRFNTLTLERTRVAFLPLSWTIVHPINENSPLWGLNEEDYAKYGVELLILLTGIDETFSQTVHARMSYSHEEIAWNMRFADIFERSEDAAGLAVDISRIDAVEPAMIS